MDTDFHLNGRNANKARGLPPIMGLRSNPGRDDPCKHLISVKFHKIDRVKIRSNCGPTELEPSEKRAEENCQSGPTLRARRISRLSQPCYGLTRPRTVQK